MKERLRTRSRVVGKVVIPDMIPATTGRIQDPKERIRFLLVEMEHLADVPSRHYDSQKDNVLEALFAAHDVLRELVRE